jgi:hypothetical protein
VGTRRTSARTWTRGGATGLTVFLVTLAISTIPSPSLGQPNFEAPFYALQRDSGLGLVVDPPSWWLTSGNRTTLAATWTGIPAGCVANPLWFRWTLIAGFAEGTLEPTEGSSVNFTAAFAESGPATVQVRSTILLTCGSSDEATYGYSDSSITVLAPLRVQNVSVTPNPVETGAPANLSGRIEGGEPPYDVRIDWDDGNITASNVSAPGPFSFLHRYSNGSFSPTVLASDATGLRANGTVDSPVSASTGFVVGLDSPTVAAEVGVPIRFSGEILDPPSDYGSVTQCSDYLPARTSEAPDNVSVQNFTCTFVSTGAAEVDFEVVPVDDDLPAEEVRWSEPVASPLAVNVSPPLEPGEVGLPTIFTVRLSGGVPPFTFTWQLSGNSTISQEVAYVDGTVQVPVWPAEPGAYALEVTVQDVLGVLVTDGSEPIPFEPSLNLIAATTSVMNARGANVEIAGTISQGTGPFLWWVVPSVTPLEESAPNGTLLSVGSFSWNGTLALEGNATAWIVVADADGGFAWETTDVPLVPPLRPSAHAVALSLTKGRAFFLNITVNGGLPPFSLGITSSAGEGWNRSFSPDGSYSFTLPTNDSGAVSLELRLRDQLGVNWTETLMVTFPPSPSNESSAPSNGTNSPSPPTPSPSNATSLTLATNGTSDLIDGFAIAGTGGAALLLLLRRWRRPHRVSPEPIDPVPILRRILEPADGADRSTVELMAEEEGIPLETVRATVDRLISEGSIRSESGPDGEEVLAWSDPDRP